MPQQQNTCLFLIRHPLVMARSCIVCVLLASFIRKHHMRFTSQTSAIFQGVVHGGCKDRVHHDPGYCSSTARGLWDLGFGMLGAVEVLSLVAQLLGLGVQTRVCKTAKGQRSRFSWAGAASAVATSNMCKPEPKYEGARIPTAINVPSVPLAARHLSKIALAYYCMVWHAVLD